ncbi:MAG: hypothetical protein LBP59_13980 [Planctomycetaceae bacterium]|nr:hypothetical protein [Planctomycetaceae bacterium]
MKFFTDSKRINKKQVSCKQTNLPTKQIACWLTIAAILFCAVTPLRGICNCDNCPYAGLVDAGLINSQTTNSIALPKISSNKISGNKISSKQISGNCIVPVCCPQHTDNSNNTFGFNFDFCICICTDSPETLINDTNQFDNLQQKDQTQSIPLNTPATLQKINTEISNYCAFHKSPIARSINRIHAILNVWQI